MTIRGETPLKFGSTAVVGYIVMEDVARESLADTVIIEDEDGDVATDISGIQPRGTVKLTVVPKTATTEPAVGSLMTVGVDGASIEFVIDKITATNKPKEPSRWAIEGHFNSAT